MVERDDRIGALLDALGLELDVAEGAELLEPVVDALLEGPPWPRLSQEGARAAEALLGEDDEFRAALKRELASARELYPEDVELALRELERPVAENAVLHALVYRAAEELLRRANENREQVAALESALAGAPPERYRELALSLAGTGFLAVPLEPEEVDEALAGLVEGLPPSVEELPDELVRRLPALAGSLATDDRRRELRAAIARIGEAAEEEFPLAAAALRALAGEPLPDDPAADELWAEFARQVVAQEFEDLLAADV